MQLEHTWRWFGPNDPVSLDEIRQTGATGIVTALHHIPAGEPWGMGEIRKRKRMIEAAGLSWSVAESIPVHEEIKRRAGGYRARIDNYKQSIVNLGRCGVDTVCYHFMPVLDWSRTDLRVVYGDGSMTTGFNIVAFAAFDLHILKRPGAERDYDGALVAGAKRYFQKLTPARRKRLLDTVLLGFPGSGEQYTPAGLRTALEGYREMGTEELRESLVSFLKEVVPVAEEAGVLLAIHPDDPPWPLLGLPRVVSTHRDIETILGAVDMNANGLTLCTGSLGAGPDNDVPGMARSFARRIHFLHLRNVARAGTREFIESDHLDGDVDMPAVMQVMVAEQRRRQVEGRSDRRLPLRPDHGHLMIPDMGTPNIYPGYSLFGRMRGLAELRGLELGIRRASGLE